VFRWRRANRTRKRLLSDGRYVPDLNEEYLLYQTLAGTWPFSFATPDDRHEYVERIKRYMTKAVHEAKINLSWINTDPAYVEALQQFVEKALAPGTRARPNAFLRQFEAFIPAVAFFGAINSLAQRLLMITAPGNPDIYQGMELWDFSLVDPDNRRRVEYAPRMEFLRDLDRRAEAGDLPGLCADLLANFQDGRIKLWTTLQAMHLRCRHRELFHEGSYTPLQPVGEKSEHVVAFAREYHGQLAIAAVPRLSLTLAAGELRPPLGELWETAEIPVPATAREFMDSVFDGEKKRITAERTLLGREVFAHFPVALLVCD